MYAKCKYTYIVIKKLALLLFFLPLTALWCPRFFKRFTYILTLIFRYYEGLQKCVGLFSEDAKYSPDQIEQLDTLYKSLRQQYSWSSAVKVIRQLF